MPGSLIATEHYIAIDNVCAWPNLTRTPDGTIVATIFNQPCHGKWEGDVECWASEDGGEHWSEIITGMAPVSKGAHYAMLMPACPYERPKVR